MLAPSAKCARPINAVARRCTRSRQTAMERRLGRRTAKPVLAVRPFWLDKSDRSRFPGRTVPTMVSPEPEDSPRPAVSAARPRCASGRFDRCPFGVRPGHVLHVRRGCSRSRPGSRVEIGDGASACLDLPALRRFPSSSRPIRKKRPSLRREVGRPTFHLRTRRAEINEPVLEDRPRHRSKRLVHAAVEVDLVVERARGLRRSRPVPRRLVWRIRRVGAEVSRLPMPGVPL